MKNVTKKNMENVKLPKLVKKNWQPRDRNLAKGQDFTNVMSKRRRRGIAPNKTEENYSKYKQRQ